MADFAKRPEITVDTMVSLVIHFKRSQTRGGNSHSSVFWRCSAIRDLKLGAVTNIGASDRKSYMKENQDEVP